ncbi:hypothetical protein HYU15_01480 [Candidatus Woesearchaeota archaeon]|nr:hypothetical protein [Candidatus Woesearchaeota archaeon]
MKLRTCPSCGSANIKLYMGGQLGIQYKCETCGYTGALIIEQDIEKKFGKKGSDAIKGY